jgi:TPR repeat protein
MTRRTSWAAVLLLGCSSALPQPAARQPEGGTSGTAEDGEDTAAYQTACEGGEAAACSHLGELMYREDRIEEAVEVLARACDAGDVSACCRRDAMLFEREFQAGDASPAAVRACRAACDAGDADGCYRYALFLGYHGGDPAPATAAYLRACDAGAFGGCADLLASAIRSAPTVEEAIAPFRTACDAGDVPRCFALGRRLLYDDRVEEAAAPLGRACDAGHPPACEALGQALLELGRTDEAERVLGGACDAWDTAACARLADRLLETNRAVEAEAPARRACEAPPDIGGVLMTCVTLVDVLDALGRTDAVVTEWQAACDGGDAVACLHLGELLEATLETSSWMAALSVFRSACAGGNRAGCMQVGKRSSLDERSEGSLSPEDRAENVRVVVANYCERAGVEDCWDEVVVFVDRMGAFPAEELEPAARASCEAGHPASCAVLERAEDRLNPTEEPEEEGFEDCEGDAEECYHRLTSALADDPAFFARVFSPYDERCARDDTVACEHAADLLDQAGHADDAAAYRGHACDRGMLDFCQDAAPVEPAPEVNEGCAGGWLDEATGLCWQDPPAPHYLTWQPAMDYCAALTSGGHDDWRLPTIRELRSLVRGCPATEPGGACEVDDDCLEADCQSRVCMGCGYEEGPGAEGAFWPAGLGGGRAYYFWSSSVAPDAPSDAWTIGFQTGVLWNDDRTSPEARLKVRCVRDGP